jgi:hypothetical protein
MRFTCQDIYLFLDIQVFCRYRSCISHASSTGSAESLHCTYCSNLFWHSGTMRNIHRPPGASPPYPCAGDGPGQRRPGAQDRPFGRPGTGIGPSLEVVRRHLEGRQGFRRRRAARGRRGGGGGCSGGGDGSRGAARAGEPPDTRSDAGRRPAECRWSSDDEVVEASEPPAPHRRPTTPS